MGPSWTWQGFALGSALFAGLTAIFGKIGVAEIPSNLATFIRTVVIILLLGGVVTLQGGWLSLDKLSGKGVIFLVLSGIATGLSWMCYYKALQLGPAGRVASVDKLSVVFVIVLAAAFLGEKLSLIKAVGAILITTGTIIMLG